jgi:hypothetical protein
VDYHRTKVGGLLVVLWRCPVRLRSVLVAFDRYTISSDTYNAYIQRSGVWSYRNEGSRELLVQLADQTISATGICI